MPLRDEREVAGQREQAPQPPAQPAHAPPSAHAHEAARALVAEELLQRHAHAERLFFGDLVARGGFVGGHYRV